MYNKALTLSIVIPVYNEERHIKACLDAIAVQTVMPNEVIVVDNNCTDKTVEIARSYPFVKLLKEPNQGRGWARTAGFNASTCDILGRIDADSMIAPNWVERVLDDFADPDVAGLTGLGLTNIGPLLLSVYSTFWSRAYFWAVHAYFNCNTVWGANSAFRRDWWRKVGSESCLDDRQVHEDQDISILVAGAGGKIIQDNKLLIKTNGRSYAFLPKLTYYAVLRHRTRIRHNRLGTLKSPHAVLLGFWNTLPGRLYTIVPGILFLVGSFISWPFYAIILARHGKLGKPWLERTPR
jgi:glycosyltransferase involved in cell wall biosynthesis